MEECVRLVCEALGVDSGDEVSVEKISILYQKVFHTAAELRDAQKAVTQVSAHNGGLPCSGRWMLHVLLEMEQERENREKLYWELQMLKSVRSVSDGINTQLLGTNSGCRHTKMRDTKPGGFSSLLERARRLYVRLDVDGVWSVLSSPSLSHVTSRRLALKNPTKSDVLLLLQYKYDIIKERLFREMLQEAYGAGWWESMEPSEQTDCVWDLKQRAEEAFKLNDMLRVCELPGVLHSYSTEGAELCSCPREETVRQGAWSLSPRRHGWTFAVFLSELHFHCEDERRALRHLIHRVERHILTAIYLNVSVSVRRAERETHSHTALLSSRQYWDNWPNTKRLDVEDLMKFWLLDEQDPTTQLRNECRTSHCLRQQAVLQCVVLSQEHERRTLVKILHSVSLQELQEQTHTLTPDYKAAGATGSALRRGCVSILRQIKSTHSSVSWLDCVVHLLTQLTHTQDKDVQTVIHTLAAMDSAALTALLHKHQLELSSPKLHNLHNLLQTSGSENILSNVSVTDSETTEQRHSSPSAGDEQQTCTGCGVVLVPEDAPYLEILGVGEKSDEERREEGEEERKEKREGDKEESREGKKEEEMKCRERREREDKKRREGKEEEKNRKEGRMEGEKEKKEGSNNEEEETEEEEKSNADAVEKQGSLITLAWSKPSSNNTQEVTSAQPETTSADSHTPDHTHSASSQHEHTLTAQRHTLVEPLQEPSTSSMDAYRTSAAALELDPENTPASEEAHTRGAVCDAACEEQQLQREATMRSLVDIQRKAERRWQCDRNRQILRVQERLSIIQNRTSEEDLLSLRREETFRHLSDTLQQVQEDEQQQKVLVREKLQQLWRERSYILQSRRERNTTEFKELLTPSAQCVTSTEDQHPNTHAHNAP